jgi:PAS domain-containing protein
MPELMPTAFQALVEHAPDGVVRVDRDLRHCYVNPWWKEAMQRSRSAEDAAYYDAAELRRKPLSGGAEGRGL